MSLWLICVASLLTLYLVLALVVKPSVALGVVLPIAWIVPSWTVWDLGFESINVKTSVGVGMLLMYCFFPRATFPWRLVPCDYAMLSLFGVGTVSDFLHNGFDLTVPAIAYAEWIVPYLAGRLAFQNHDDVKWVWPVLAVVAIILGAVAVIEAWLGMNPYEWFFGLRPLEGVSRNAERWNIRRAYVTCLHPLYHGVLLCWMFAWTLHGAWRALQKRSGPLWLVAPLLGFFAPLATGSRGPFIGNFVVLAAAIFCAARRRRLPMTVAAGVLAFVFLFFQDRVFDFLDDWAGEFEHGKQAQSVSFDNQAEIVSSARARFTLFKIYWMPLTRAGLFGYGSNAVAQFPVNVPIGSEEAEAARTIWALDNSYIVLTLRFGYLGLIAFIALISLSLWQCKSVYDDDPLRSQALFAASLSGATLAVAGLIVGVWMPQDFGFPWLWGIGASSGLYYQVRHQRLKLKQIEAGLRS